MAVLFLVIQQAENNLIVPMVMGRSLDLRPVSLIFTVLVMGTLLGLMGAVLAVPVCAIVKVCRQEFYLKPRHKNMAALETRAADIVDHAEAGRHDAGEAGAPGEQRGARPLRRRASLGGLDAFRSIAVRGTLRPAVWQ